MGPRSGYCLSKMDAMREKRFAGERKFVFLGFWSLSTKTPIPSQSSPHYSYFRNNRLIILSSLFKSNQRQASIRTASVSVALLLEVTRKQSFGIQDPSHFAFQTNHRLTCIKLIISDHVHIHSIRASQQYNSCQSWEQ